MIQHRIHDLRRLFDFYFLEFQTNKKRFYRTAIRKFYVSRFFSFVSFRFMNREIFSQQFFRHFFNFNTKCLFTKARFSFESEILVFFFFLFTFFARWNRNREAKVNFAIWLRRDGDWIMAKYFLFHLGNGFCMWNLVKNFVMWWEKEQNIPIHDSVGILILSFRF